MSDDQDHPRRGGDDGTERALDELRAALEQLAARMGAGFREDLAQIRAIAASVAERDLTGDVEALRVDVATLVGRDTGSEVRDDLAALRAEMARMASSEDVTGGLRSGLAPLQSAVDRISARLDDESGRAQVLARLDALDERLGHLAGADGSAEVLARIDALSARLDSLPSAQQIANLSGDLRAHLADGLAGFDGEAVMREVAAVRGRLGNEQGTLLEQLQDNLADVASGEVVGALWDEVRQLRTDLPDLVPTPEPVTEVREPDPQLAGLVEELTVLRTELAEGLVVEPSDALSASLDALRSELDELGTGLADLRSTPEPPPTPPVDDTRDEQLLGQLDTIRAGIDDVRSRLDGAAEATTASVAANLAGPTGAMTASIDALRTEVDGLRGGLAALSAAAEPVDDGRDEQLLDQLGTIRAGIDGLRARLDESMALAEEAEPATMRDEPDRADIDTLADQVAALRDFIASELDTIRQTVAARLDAAAESTAATVAAATARPEPEPRPEPAAAPGEIQATIDPETVELLRDEIRASGAIGDQVVDALREELKALRRRIAVKAAERVLDEQQLAQIAEAVADRLAEDGRQG